MIRISDQIKGMMLLRVGKIFSQLIKLIEIKKSNLKISIAENLIKITSNAVALLCLLMLAFFVLFFLSMFLCVYLNYLLDSFIWGYVIMTTIYLVFLIYFIYNLKTKRVQKYIKRMIINFMEDDVS